MASLLRTSVYEAGWQVQGKTKNYHNQTSSALNTVCPAAYSFVMSGCGEIKLNKYTDIHI